MKKIECFQEKKEEILQFQTYLNHTILITIIL
jgi:hypothetical protein